MRTFAPRRAVQVPVAPGGYDYADAYEICLDEPDGRTAEDFARHALEESPWPVRTTIWVVHRYVIGFRLGPRTDPNHVLGWTILRSEPEVVELEAVSSLLRAVLVAEWRTAGSAAVTTYLFYRRPAAARAIWKVVRPLHQSVARYLLQHAAAS
jgi:hypothetical protein